jgi:hypothetical protein
MHHRPYYAAETLALQVARSERPILLLVCCGRVQLRAPGGKTDRAERVARNQRAAQELCGATIQLLLRPKFAPSPAFASPVRCFGGHQSSVKQLEHDRRSRVLARAAPAALNELIDLTGKGELVMVRAPVFRKD